MFQAERKRMSKCEVCGKPARFMMNLCQECIDHPPWETYYFSRQRESIGRRSASSATLPFPEFWVPAAPH